MIRYNFNSTDEIVIKNFVDECENNFFSQINKVSNEVFERDGLKIITLSGPTCSGKTTTADTLIKYMNERGKRVKVVSVDDFFRDRHELEKEALKQNRAIDMDSVAAIDLNCFKNTVDEIFSAKEVEIPIFDFSTGSRKGYRTVKTEDYDIFLFEGIQAIYPEVIDCLDDHPSLDIFISVGNDIEVNGRAFSKSEIRFMRRLIRDFRFRNTTPEDTFKHWRGVRENEIKNIEPYTDKPKFKIDSFMKYEPFMLKVPVTELLERIPEDSEFYEIAVGIKKKFENIPALSPVYIPHNSVYREFLG